MKNSLFIFISLLCSAFSGFAQDIQFELVPRLKDELVGTIFSMTQDNMGYLWLGTNYGLYKYDGFHYTVYHFDPSDSTGLTSDQIETVMADRQGMIWIGHYHNSSGLERLDPSTGKFTHYTREENNIHSLTCDSITAIRQDAEGTIWVGTEDGLNRYDSQNNRFDQFRHIANDSTSLSNGQVRIIYEDKQHILWIGTGNPWVSENSNREGGINKFDGKSGTFTRYVHKENDPHSLIDNRVRAIYEDSKGNFWVGSANDGLQKMDREAGSFDRIPYGSTHPDNLSGHWTTGAANGADDHITFITEDSKSRLWIGTFNSGINVYDPEMKSTTFYGVRKDSKEKSLENDFWTAFKTKDGVLWISSWSGNLYKVNTTGSKVPYTSMDASVLSFWDDHDSSLWLATNKGLAHMDDKGPIHWFQVLKDSSTYKNVIIGAHKDENNRLWIATLNGLYYFDSAANKIIAYQPNNQDAIDLMKDTINTIAIAGGNQLWLATNGRGLIKLNVNSGAVQKYKHNSRDSNSLANDFVQTLATDKNGNLWVGTAYGLEKLDAATGHFKKYITKHDVTFVFQDGLDDIWAATLTGLYRYNRNTDDFMIYTDPSGIIKSNWSVFGIVEDHQRMLWVNTVKGIVRLNGDRTEAVLFGKNQGYDPQISTNLGVVRQNGDVLYGDRHGYFTFQNGLLQQDTSAPSVNINRFLLNDLVIEPSPGGILSAPLQNTQELRLRHNQNTFSIGFSNIDFRSNHEDIRILYKLENYDNNWRESGENREAYYFNLPPGKYLFKVKSFGANGKSSEKQLSVIISPPWWTSWWAYSLYSLCLIFGIFITDRIRRKNVIEKEQARTRERELAQAKTIEKAYTDLKNTQAQLIQSEKMASLGELTAGIAHEIQNPLNFVNNFSEVNAELIDEAESAIDAGSPAEAKALLRSLRSNQLKINQHGKRADAIVKGMLQHSRTGTNVKESTDINGLADEYLRLAYHGLRAQDKNLNVAMQTNYDPAIGNINIVPQDIGRVLLNLYNNAFYVVSEKKKQQPEGFIPTVSVNTARVNGRVEIVVKDNGNGVPQKVVEKIFQPFFTTKPAGRGTGLGLSLSYDIIKAHGGEIHVQSKEGEGAAFVIQLPV